MKLGNVRKISNLGGDIAQCLVSLQELTLCQQQLKNTQKQIPNFSFPVQFYWITPFCSKYFVRDCLSKQIFGSNSAQSPSNSNFLTFFITPKHFYDLLPHELPNDLRLQEIRKYQKNLKFEWSHSLVPSLLSRTSALPIAVKKHAKTDTKLFSSCPVLLDYSILFQIFCPGLSEQANFWS